MCYSLLLLYYRGGWTDFCVKYLGVEHVAAALKGADCIHCECFTMKHLGSLFSAEGRFKALGQLAGSGLGGPVWIWRRNRMRVLLYFLLFPPDPTLWYQVDFSLQYGESARGGSQCVIREQLSVL